MSSEELSLFYRLAATQLLLLLDCTADERLLFERILQ